MGLANVQPQPAYAAAPSIYAPWDSGKQFAVGNPGGSVGGGYYGHCCGKTPDLDYYAVDINGPGGGNTDCGENVRAIAGGTIGQVGTYTGGGISYLRVDHGGGYVSEYQHITNPLANGTAVARGDIIAKFGNIGTTSCHLHFVLKYNGTSIPPSPMSGTALPSSGGAWVTSNNDSTPPPPAQDTDGDGVTDASPDWCIYDKGPAINHGCPNSIHQLSGDFDGDSRGDAVSVSRGPDNAPGLAWFRSTSDATTTALDNPISLSVVLPAPAWNVDGLKWAAGDFNGDHRSDLLAVSGTPTSGPALYILLSNGSQFGNPQPVASPNPAYWQWGLLEFFAGDINGDGKDDVIYSSRSPNGNPGLGWFPSTSTGITASLAPPNAFSVILPAPAWNTYNLKWSVGDFNGDGKGDLLAVSGSQTDGPALYILTSTGSQLANPVNVAAPNPAYWKWDRITFMAANVDGDNRDDIIYISRGPNNDPGLGWFPSTSTATTTSVSNPIAFSVALPAPAWNMSGLKWAITDSNGDGKKDVFAVSGTGYSGPSLYLLTSTGSQLANPTNVGSPNPAYWQWCRLQW